MEFAKEEKVISFDFRESQVPSFKPSLTEELNKLIFVKLNASFKPFLLSCFSFLETGIALWFFVYILIKLAFYNSVDFYFNFAYWWLSLAKVFLNGTVAIFDHFILSFNVFRP